MAIKLIYNVGIFFLIMLPGIILKKCKLSTDGLGKGLSNLVLYIAQPALIFLSYLRDFDKAVFKNIIFVFVFSVLAHVIFTAITLCCFKKSPDQIRRMLRFATIFSNAAFMGMPLIKEVMGASAVIYASVYNITFNGFLWTLGVYICTANRDVDGDGIADGAYLRKKSGISYKKAFLHPTMVAAYLGLLFFFLPIHTYVPKIITDGLSRLEALVAPLSMIVLGLRLAEIDLKGFFKEKNLYVFIALRHLILPTVVYFVMRLFTLGINIHTDVIMSVLIMVSAPAATSATMFAEKYDCDATYVSKVVAVSTILSIATMPIISLLVMI